MSDKDFASRWADRKRKVAEEAEATDVPEVSAEEAAVEEKTDAEILEELGLKDPEALEEGDDFSGFMNSAIPTRIRNRALRKLWATNPAFAVVDGLVEYGEDYTDAATVVENLQTAYQVGKGILNKMAEIESDDDTAIDNVLSPIEAPREVEGTEVVEQPTVDKEFSPSELKAVTGVSGDETGSELAENVKSNRRMCFQFEDDA